MLRVTGARSGLHHVRFTVSVVVVPNGSEYPCALLAWHMRLLGVCSRSPHMLPSAFTHCFTLGTSTLLSDGEL